MREFESFLANCYLQYLREERNILFEKAGIIGDLAEVGLVCEELGETMKAMRRKKKEKIGIECADALVRLFNFMTRKEYDVRLCLVKAYEKNEERERKGIYVEDKSQC